MTDKEWQEAERLGAEHASVDLNKFNGSFINIEWAKKRDSFIRGYAAAIEAKRDENMRSYLRGVKDGEAK